MRDQDERRHRQRRNGLEILDRAGIADKIRQTSANPASSRMRYIVLPPSLTLRAQAVSARHELNSQIAVLKVRCASERLRGAAPDNATAFDQVMAIGDADERIDILVDNEDRLSRLLQMQQALPDLGADERCKTFGRFVENKKTRVCHQ